MGLLDEDSTSSTNLEKKASLEEEREEEDNDDDEEVDDAPPSSFGSIAADLDPSKDQKPNKPRDSPFKTVPSLCLNRLNMLRQMRFCRPVDEVAATLK